MYCVYLHKNLINGKVYIGQTKFGENPNKRWINGEGYKNQYSFYEDILRYGWDNFEHIILANNLTLEQANELEIKFINDYQSLTSKYGYNTMIGGGNTGRVRSLDITTTSPSSKEQNLYFNDENGILRSRKTKQSLEDNKIRYIKKLS